MANGNIKNIGKVEGNAKSSPKSDLAGCLKNRWIQWTFVLSCVAISAAFVKPTIVSLLGNAFAFAIAYYITFHRKILEHVFSPFSRTTLGIVFIFTLIAVGFCVPHFLSHLQTQIDFSSSIHPALVHIAVYFLYCTTAPAFFAFLYAFIVRFSIFVTEIYKTSDKIERCFFVTVMLFAMSAIIVIYDQTNCFYAPLGQDGEIIDFDVVYVMDSGNFYKTNVYGFIGAPENDMRQPLFGLFALPFAITATLLSWILFFIPNSYAVFMQTIQIGLLFVTYILMSRVAQLRGLTKLFFFMTLTVTYPILLFSLVWEQYIFSIFWLWVFIYIFTICGQIHPIAFTASTGSLLTNTAAFLFTFTKNRQQFIRKGIDCACAFLIFFILFGRLNVCTGALHLFAFTGIKSSFDGKILQFVNFISSCFVKPETIISKPFFKSVSDWTNYQLAPVESLNLLGLLLLAFCFLGFVLNYKDRFAQICAFWIAFSFFVLCLVGWGTAENGLILYSLYFGWAYFCLAFLAIEKLLQKLPTIKYAVYSACIAVLAYINIPGIYDVIQFGIKYYPVQ